jgi:hypothetical protein
MLKPIPPNANTASTRRVMKLKLIETLKRRNVVTRKDALLTTTSPDEDKPQSAAAAWVARNDSAQLLGRLAA